MAEFSKAVQMVKLQPSTQFNYCGIERRFFPKWKGWIFIDNNELPSDELVDKFYTEFFWDKLRLSELHSQDLAELIFVFSICNGKRKIIDKLDRVLGMSSDGLLTSFMIQKLNSLDANFIFLYLYAELVEFCFLVGTKKDFMRLLRIYNRFVAESL